MLSYKDSKLSFILKNLYKEYTRVNLLFHVAITDSNIEGCLKTLESSERIKINKNANKEGATKEDGSVAEGDN